MLRWRREVLYGHKTEKGYYNLCDKGDVGSVEIPSAGCCIGGYQYLPEVLFKMIGSYLQSSPFLEKTDENDKNGILISRENIYFNVLKVGLYTRIWAANATMSASIEFVDNWKLTAEQIKFLEAGPEQNLELCVKGNFLDIVTIGRRGMASIPEMLHRRVSLIAVIAKCMLLQEGNKELRKLYRRFEWKVKKMESFSSVHFVNFICCAFKKYASSETLKRIKKDKLMTLPRPYFGRGRRTNWEMVICCFRFFCHGTGKYENFRHYYNLTVGDDVVMKDGQVIVTNLQLKESNFCKTLLLNWEDAKKENYGNRLPSTEPLPLPVKKCGPLYQIDYEKWAKQEKNGACGIEFFRHSEQNLYGPNGSKNDFKGHFYGWPSNLEMVYDKGENKGKRIPPSKTHRRLDPFFEIQKQASFYLMRFVAEPMVAVNVVASQPFCYYRPTLSSCFEMFPMKLLLSDYEKRLERQAVVAESGSYVYQLKQLTSQPYGTVSEIHINRDKHVIKDTNGCQHLAVKPYKEAMINVFKTISNDIKKQYNIQGDGTMNYPYMEQDWDMGNVARHIYPPYLFAFFCDVAVHYISINLEQGILDFTEPVSVCLRCSNNADVFILNWISNMRGFMLPNGRQKEFENGVVPEGEMASLLFLTCKELVDESFFDCTSEARAKIVKGITTCPIHELLRSPVAYHLTDSVFDDFSGTYLGFLLYLFRRIHNERNTFNAIFHSNVDFIYAKVKDQAPIPGGKGAFYFLDRSSVAPEIPFIKLAMLKSSQFPLHVQEVVVESFNDDATSVSIQFDKCDAFPGAIRVVDMNIKILDIVMPQKEVERETSISWLRLQQILYCVDDYKRRTGKAMVVETPHILPFFFTPRGETFKTVDTVHVPRGRCLPQKWWHKCCVGALRLDKNGRCSTDVEMYAYILLHCRGFDKPANVQYACLPEAKSGEQYVWNDDFIKSNRWAATSVISSGSITKLLNHWAGHCIGYNMVRSAKLMVEGVGLVEGVGGSSGSNTGEKRKTNVLKKTKYKKVLQHRTYQNDQGYFVTKSDYVEVTDDEESNGASVKKRKT